MEGPENGPLRALSCADPVSCGKGRSMQLTCPTCGARYRIDASNWPTEPGAEPGPGGEPVFRARRARCKVCRSVWNALPEEELLELDDPLPPEEEPRQAPRPKWSKSCKWR